MLTESDLLELTATALPHWPKAVRLDAILKGGSDRSFYRLQFDSTTEAGVILMQYTLSRPDNPRFVPATLRLQKLGVHVPRIFANDTQNLCIWLEDLGNEDLYAYREQSWAVRQPLYEATLMEAAKLHIVNADALPESDTAEMELRFDERLYEWEQNYFLTHFVQSFLKRDTDALSFKTAHLALREIRTSLSILPRGLVHRDFQSQNVIIRDQSAWLIDYQGLRPGLAEYDLASLLLDPYVSLTEPERESLLQWYANHTHRNLESLKETYLWCAAQRLMQALGAYANLSRNLGKPHFEQHIPIAVERLKQVCASHPALESLQVFL